MCMYINMRIKKKKKKTWRIKVKKTRVIYKEEGERYEFGKI